MLAVICSLCCLPKEKRIQVFECGQRFVQKGLIILVWMQPNLHHLLFAEQYESFVKFTQDQIMRRYGARPASCKYMKLFSSQRHIFPVNTSVLRVKKSTALIISCVSDVS